MSLKRSDRHEEVIELAEAIADDSSQGIQVEPAQILRDSEVGISFGDYGEAFDGLLEYEDGKFFVFANQERGNLPDSPRGRFTLGHEVGHFFIDEHRRAIRNGVGRHASNTGLFDAASCKEEHEADLFSANLLMPPSRFCKRLTMTESPLKQIKRLARDFKTSVTSTALQFIALSPIPTAAIAWDAEGTYRWISLADELQKDDRCKYWEATKYRRDGCLPIDSATGEVVLSGEVDEAESATTASAVFVNVQSGGYRDDILKEECIKLGKYGFLTILSPHPNG